MSCSAALATPVTALMGVDATIILPKSLLFIFVSAGYGKSQPFVLFDHALNYKLNTVAMFATSLADFHERSRESMDWDDIGDGILQNRF